MVDMSINTKHEQRATVEQTPRVQPVASGSPRSGISQPYDKAIDHVKLVDACYLYP